MEVIAISVGDQRSLHQQLLLHKVHKQRCDWLCRALLTIMAPYMTSV